MNKRLIGNINVFNFLLYVCTDPLFEKYAGWTPYQYSGNNPVNLLDDNGKWAKEVSQEWHIRLAKIFDPNVSRNRSGYLAEKNKLSIL